MTDLVLLHHNEPMTTSLAIAGCTENEHGSVILLVRKYINDLEEFGEVSFQTAKPGTSRFEIANKVFEIENCRSEKGRQTEFAFLNEQQATLLITFMRNTDTVRRFKIALVKAFYALRDQLRVAATTGPSFTTTNLSHGADLAVAADRTFRGFLRSGRSAGLTLPQALRAANRQTIERTGLDMLAELDVDPDALEVSKQSTGKTRPADPMLAALQDWIQTAGPGPWRASEIVLGAFGIPEDDSRFMGVVSQAGKRLASIGLIRKYEKRENGKTGRWWHRRTNNSVHSLFTQTGLAFDV